MEQERDLSATLAEQAGRLTNFLADRRGLPLLLGLLFVVLNFICQFIPALGWFADYDVLLHLGLVLSISGSLLSSAL